MTSNNMKAVNYQGPFKVKVEDVPMPKLEHPDDIIVKVTTVSKTVDLSIRQSTLSDRTAGGYLRLGLTVSTGI
jgi:hypothetical protein